MDRNRLPSIVTVLTILLAAISCLAALWVVPEVRSLLGLPNSSEPAFREDSGQARSRQSIAEEEGVTPYNDRESLQQAGKIQPERPPDSTPSTQMERQITGNETTLPSKERALAPIQEQEKGTLTTQSEVRQIDQDAQYSDGNSASLGLKGTNVYIIFSGAREDDASEVKRRLSSAGANVSMDEEAPEDSGSYSWNRLSYSECHQEAARMIKSMVSDIVRITLMRSADPCGPNLVLYLVS